MACEGASAAGAGRQRTGREDQLHRGQGSTPRLQSFQLTEDPPGDRHLPESVSPPHTHTRTSELDHLVSMPRFVTLSQVYQDVFSDYFLPHGSQTAGPTS